MSFASDEHDSAGPRLLTVPDSVAVRQSMQRWSMRALRNETLPEQRVVAPGVTAVAMWRDRRCGSVPFYCENTSGVLPFPAVLRHVDGRQIGPWWTETGGGVAVDSQKEGPTAGAVLRRHGSRSSLPVVDRSRKPRHGGDPSGPARSYVEQPGGR
jgi:hypothetical protein